jgi:putative membrane protein
MNATNAEQDEVSNLHSFPFIRGLQLTYHPVSYERFQSEQLILRDELALDRTRLANERTFLAYERTGLMVTVAGATAIKFFTEFAWAVISGWVLMVLGLAIAVFGIWRFAVMAKSLRRVGKLRAAVDE